MNFLDFDDNIIYFSESKYKKLKYLNNSLNFDDKNIFLWF